MAQPHVGTLGEKPLHASLKRWYSQPGDRLEQPVGRYVIDIVRGDQLIEIQTRGFSSMKKKLAVLLDSHPVRVVHPIATERLIIKVDDNGEVVSRRRSPKRGRVVDVFTELVSFPTLVGHEHFGLDVLLTRQEEVRLHDPTKAWRRKGWVVDERRLVEVVDHVVLDSPAALAELLPEDLPEEFTTADLASGVQRPRRLAQQMAYCLRELAVIEVARKSGNANVFVRRSGC